MHGKRGRLKVEKWHETVLALFREQEVNTEKPMEMISCDGVNNKGHLLIAIDDDFLKPRLEMYRANNY
jgi:mannitol-1-phosphate/altronate dehydrogenase